MAENNSIQNLQLKKISGAKSEKQKLQQDNQKMQFFHFAHFT